MDVTLGGWPIELQQGAIASTGRNADGSLPAGATANRRNECERFSSEDLILRRRKFPFRGSSGEADETVANLADSIQCIPAARLDFSRFEREISLAAELEFIHRRRDAACAGLACSFADACPALEQGLDRGRRPCGKNARHAQGRIARDILARHGGFSRAYGESPAREPAGAAWPWRMSNLRRCSEPLRLSDAEALGTTWQWHNLAKKCRRAMDV